MKNETTLIHLEDLGETTQVQVNGFGKDLVELIARALISSSELKQVVEMALIETYMHEFKQQETEHDSEASLISMLSKMNIGLS